MEKGDRIQLISMPEDPDPVPAMTTGTVTSVSEISGLTSRPYTQVGVDWDNGRSLGLVMPPDVARVIVEDFEVTEVGFEEDTDGSE